MNLVIVDVGCGNIGSVGIAFERFGVSPRISGEPHVIAAADKVILPGVGAAGYAMEQIGGRGLVPVLRALTQPVLGICLGMQLLFEHSEEEDTQCLGLIPGRVRRLAPAAGRPVPHLGWSKLVLTGGEGGALACSPDEGSAPHVSGLSSGDYVYFAHSFACDAGPATAAFAEYGREIPAVVRVGNFLGAQFHPERSGEAGARFLESFLKS